LLHGLESFEPDSDSPNPDVLGVNAELAREWLRKAGQSLIAAELLVSEPNFMLEIAVHHCQQAGEKTLKGYLTMQDQLALKTHDLKRLSSECARFNPSFHEFEAETAWLNPLAAGYRYPGDTNCPALSSADLDKALAAARRIYDFVLSVLPAETHPV
jgi:HEPN domain-containing protein